MNNKMSDIFYKLQQRGLIDANALLETTSDSSQQDNPWFLQALFGFSGLFASLFFVGFLTLLLFETRVFDSSVGLLLIGLVLSATGFTLFRNERLRDNAFMSSLAFAVSVAGQAYVAFALLNGDLYQPVDVWLFLMLQGFMTLVMPNRVYRLLSALITLCCLVYLLSFYRVSEVSLGLLALIAIATNLQRYELLQRVPVKWRVSFADVLSAIAYANAIVLLGVSVYFIAAEYGGSFDNYGDHFIYNYYLAQGLLTFASLYAAYLILKRYSINLLSKSGVLIICAIVVLGVMSVYVSGLLATILIIVIAMANSQRVLLGLGIFALVSYIFWYYYQLDTSLLVKSGSMLIIGIVMLLTRWLLISRYFVNDKQRMNAADNKERLS
ncbi:DUF4401 domain-containing protein [Psychrobacter sp.]|uniref:DUF4401 domain-containing protein n=1 Tax=Psychrobacter sp. TaxID=56811 RepID=UPI003BB1E66E